MASSNGVWWMLLPRYKQFFPWLCRCQAPCLKGRQGGGGKMWEVVFLDLGKLSVFGMRRVIAAGWPVVCLVQHMADSYAYSDRPLQLFSEVAHLDVPTGIPGIRDTH